MNKRFILPCFWIWAIVLAHISVDVEGLARGAQPDEEWIDLDHEEHEQDLLRKARSQGSMQMLLRTQTKLFQTPKPPKDEPPKEEEEEYDEYLIPAEDINEVEEHVDPKPDINEIENLVEPQPATEKPQPQNSPPRTCNANGSSRFPFHGRDNAERLLLREGIIKEIPPSRCGSPTGGKNVILVIGDGMGWEMARAGAVARRVIDELESMGCNTTSGCPDNYEAYSRFEGRTLFDYYGGGQGSGLSFQNLTGYALVTTSVAVTQKPNLGNNSAPPYSLLEGSVNSHENGMAPMAKNKCGFPIDFDPRDHMTAGGNMVLWDDVKGGKYPWDRRYTDPSILQESDAELDGFDPLFILQHASDSSATATALATGQKVANTMQSVNLYEEEVPTIVEQAMKCGKAAGVVSSKPVLHATPGTFISHSNYRKHYDQIRRSFRQVNPTMASGTCARQMYPFPEDLESMRSGRLSHTWTLFEQKPTVMAENFYDGLENLDPDNGDHVLVCLGGDFTPSKKEELPYRGVDSSYSKRWCGQGTVVVDPNPNISVPVAVAPNTYLCDRYSQEEIKQIPHISKNVKAALDFLSKDDDGFFLMYEQGDIDTAAHSNHMDDLLGTLLDIDESVGVIMEWIENNGGWNKNSLYVTADHDHYLTLLPNFPERLAKLLIAGESHNITPENFSDQNPWDIAIKAKRHEDSSKPLVEHLKDFSTWTEDDIRRVGHFWGPVGSGGNGWGSHSTRPVPLYYGGDGQCIRNFMGKGYQVLGRDVPGLPEKIDNVHIHACMMKNLFGYP